MNTAPRLTPTNASSALEKRLNASEKSYRAEMLKALWRMRQVTQTEHSMIAQMIPPTMRCGCEVDLDALMWAIGLCAREDARLNT